ncbi:hypothetical protein [Natrinema sp. SYSU A 869]|uniref:hypothetical protein n=1 Tax=Natrinema sp. SYSU A 869 TaxID=2871694 RepID=UPI001CA41D4E|nr:hypothetical protein [Natrinema sp. SYSU A 869]
MTDAALEVTQSEAEQFTQQYLESLGCSIDMRGKQWLVTVPEEADTIVEPGTLTLVPSADEEDSDEDKQFLHPESAFFQELIEEAADRAPIGSMTLTADDVEIRVPDWATESSAEVVDTSFTPYYDRTALTILFHISIETVSEYQTQLLRAISLDVRSNEPLPGITRAFLDQTKKGSDRFHEWNGELSADRIRNLLNSAGGKIREQIRLTIDEIHDDASRAADAELEEYRRLQEQRIAELEEKIESLTDTIDELSATLQQTGDEAERMEALRQRKELKQERTELQTELSELNRQRETGFPEKQREIRDRHALKVRLKPVSITLVKYETGDLVLSLATDTEEGSITVGYGSGVGETESVTCEFCDRELTAKNPVQFTGNYLGCSKCKSTFGNSSSS